MVAASARAASAFGIVGLAIGAAARVGVFKRSTERLRLKYERETSRYLEMAGLRVHYHDQGDGPTVVFVHGSYGSLRGWDPIVDRLATSHRCIRWDQPGMGLSTVDPEQLDDDLHGLAVMEGLLDELRAGRVSIVATSSGGTLATAYAAAHPDRVDRLMIANAPPDPVVFGDVDRPTWLRLALAFCDKVLGHRPLMLWWLYLRSLWGDPTRLHPEKVREYRDFWAVRRPGAPGHLILRIPSVEESVDRLARVTCPVLLVWGLRDYVLPRRTLDSFADRLIRADVRTVIMPDVGHYPPLEVPEEFIAIARPFLTDANAA